MRTPWNRLPGVCCRIWNISQTRIKGTLSDCAILHSAPSDGHQLNCLLPKFRHAVAGLDLVKKQQEVHLYLKPKNFRSPKWWLVKLRTWGWIVTFIWEICAGPKPPLNLAGLSVNSVLGREGVSILGSLSHQAEKWTSWTMKDDCKSTSVN
jgi:hypothetical protein